MVRVCGWGEVGQEALHGYHTIAIAKPSSQKKATTQIPSRVPAFLTPNPTHPTPDTARQHGGIELSRKHGGTRIEYANATRSSSDIRPPEVIAPSTSSVKATSYSRVNRYGEKWEVDEKGKSLTKKDRQYKHFR